MADGPRQNAGSFPLSPLRAAIRRALHPRHVLILALVGPGAALADPVGGNVVRGEAVITRPDQSTTLIDQSSQRAVIDWQSFNIGAGELVRFIQPGRDAATLNRVTGGSASEILGALEANGQVFLVNPQGILFGAGARVDVHGLVATTLDIDNDAFMAGRHEFERSAASPAEGVGVLNRGLLNANEGYIVLAGDYTANEGIVQARLGQVALAAGNRITLDIEGDRLLSIAVDEAVLTGRAGVENLGSLIADGGRVIMTASVARELAATSVNNQGVVRARTVEELPGEVFLLGGMEHDRIVVGGTLDASAPDGGDGGFIETSAAALRFDDPTVTGAAPHGKGGLWLIDPTDITIAADSCSGDNCLTAVQIVNTLSEGVDVTIETVAAGDDAGNITVDATITKFDGPDATLTLSAHNDININASITSTSDRLNLVLNPDSDASGSGQVNVDSGRIDTNGGTVDASGKTITLNSGRIDNSTIIASNLATSGTSELSNATIGSDLILAGGLRVFGSLLLADGVTFTTGSQHVRFRSAANVIGLADGATSATLIGGGGALLANDANNNGTVTIAEGVTLTGWGDIRQAWNNGHWINYGTITNTGGRTISPTSFTNHGTVRAESGRINLSPTNLHLEAGNTLSTAGGTLYIRPGSAWSNAEGTTELTSGILELYGGPTPERLGTLVRTGGALRLNGTIDLGNSETPLDIGDGGDYGPGGVDTFSGVIRNGTIVGDTLTMQNCFVSTCYFENVTIGSDLVLTGGGQLNIHDNLLLADGVTLDIGSSWVYFVNRSGAGAHAAIGLADGATSAALTGTGVLYLYDLDFDSATGTIGSGVTLAGAISLRRDLWYPGNWINEGTILYTTTGTPTIWASEFTNNGTMRVEAGTVNVDATEFMQSGTLIVDAGAALASNADIVNEGTLAGGGTLALGDGALTNKGTIAPGASPGTLTIDGDLIMDAASVLDIELGGTAEGEHDRVHVTGDVTLGGTVNATLFGGYVPVGGDFMPFVTMDGTSGGTFDVLNLPTGFTVGYALAPGEAARLIHAALGGPNTFINAEGDLSWHQDANWSLGWMPVPDDDVLISAGYDVLYNQGTSTIATLTINGGNALEVAAGELTVTGAADVAGAVSVTGGALNLNGTANIADLAITAGQFNLNDSATVGAAALSGGTLGGAGDVTVTGALDVTGASSISGSGTLITEGPATLGANLTASGGLHWINEGVLNVTGGTLWIQNAAFTNAAGASLTLAGAASMDLDGNSTLTNAEGATLNLSTSAATPLRTDDGDVAVINAGTLNHTGAGVHALSGFSLSNTGTIHVGAGTLDVAADFGVNAGTITVAPGATFRRTGGFTNTGMISGEGTVAVGAGNVLTNSGTVAPGASPGTLTIDGDFTQTAGGVLSITLDDPTPGGHGVLAVSGTATLGGTVAFNGAGAEGDYPFLTASQVAGEFGAIGGTLEPELTYATDHALASLGVTPVPVEPEPVPEPDPVPEPVPEPQPLPEPEPQPEPEPEPEPEPQPEPEPAPEPEPEPQPDPMPGQAPALVPGHIEQVLAGWVNGPTAGAEPPLPMASAQGGEAGGSDTGGSGPEGDVDAPLRDQPLFDLVDGGVGGQICICDR
ncbi:filamentous hemagglutinin N-terminal domain-containing protein [Thioalkalivibrio thiocyanodenitrificans]|uniref:filamentous hemagglutinin N-terminal domain-containing protein n=1 Tax=Thioalkalivibrio thiocyanodenitrificans TaxID=243063 RepID=UPI00039B48B6|nr:filamentous hemagglutinin N-terminal domain-containing protein [Thioalkalivibrio thiocyanodenitrificans]